MDKRQLFAKRLRELRKSKGLTQKELGRRLNVTEAAVGMWEQARALARLDDAYFFPEGHNAISKSEYLVKKAEFQQRLSKVDSEIAALTSKCSSTMSIDIEMFSRFLLVHNLYTADNIRDVLPALDKQVVQDFLRQVISFIEVADGRVTKIAFNSPDGEVIHRFVYREPPS